MEKKYNEIFRDTYNGENIEETIQILKDAGISQMDTLKLLRDELNLSIHDADNLVLNATAWKENKQVNEYLRNSFADIIKNMPSDN
jgi:hypothetical protein